MFQLPKLHFESIVVLNGIERRIFEFNDHFRGMLARLSQKTFATAPIAIADNLDRAVSIGGRAFGIIVNLTHSKGVSHCSDGLPRNMNAFLNNHKDQMP
jgi:hypothetical protein